MAAWTGLALMVGMLVGGVIGWVLCDHLTEPIEMVEVTRPEAPQAGDQAILERVLDRLLSAVVPEPQVEAPDEVEPYLPGEYVPPEVEVGDWTDPFFGIERPLVARLAPGQAIPGLEPIDDEHVDAVQMWQDKGEGAFDEWARDTMAPGAGLVDGSWVDPIGEV